MPAACFGTISGPSPVINMLPLAFARSPDDGLPEGPNGYCVTLVIGHFIAQVLGVTAPRRVTVNVPNGFPLLSIWPALPWDILGRRNRVDDRTLARVEAAITFTDPDEWGSGYPNGLYGSFGWD